MLLSIKKYITDYIIKIKTQIVVDTDFYDDDFYLSDMESDD